MSRANSYWNVQCGWAQSWRAQQVFFFFLRHTSMWWELRCVLINPLHLDSCLRVSKSYPPTNVSWRYSPNSLHKTANTVQTESPSASKGYRIRRENHAKADSFKHAFVAFWFPYYPVNTCQHECICSWVCVSVFKEGELSAESSQGRGELACILSLCGLCCSDKFRVCPDFLVLLVPKTPPGDSKHHVHTKSSDHDHMHIDTHTHAYTKCAIQLG